MSEELYFQWIDCFGFVHVVEYQFYFNRVDQTISTLHYSQTHSTLSKSRKQITSTKQLWNNSWLFMISHIQPSIGWRSQSFFTELRLAEVKELQLGLKPPMLTFQQMLISLRVPVSEMKRMRLRKIPHSNYIPSTKNVKRTHLMGRVPPQTEVPCIEPGVLDQPTIWQDLHLVF